MVVNSQTNFLRLNSLPNVRVFKNRAFWLGFLAVPTFAGIISHLCWQSYIRSPQYSLDQLAIAVEDRNVALIEKYVDTESTIISVAQFYQQTSQGNTANWQWVEENPHEVRVQIEQSLQQSAPPLDFNAIRRNFTYIRRYQDVAVVGWEWQRGALNTTTADNLPATIELCLEDKGAYWQLKGICNFFPGSVSELP